MGVNLSGCDIGVAEQFLHDAQVRSAFEQVRREAMTQRMRADRLGNAAEPRVPADESPDIGPIHRTSGARHEESVHMRRGLGEDAA